MSVLSLCIGMLIAPGVFGVGHAALPDSPPQGTWCRGIHCECLLRDGQAHCTIQVQVGEPTYVHFPALITDVNFPQRGDFQFAKVQNTIVIEPNAGVSTSRPLPMAVEAGTDVQVSFAIRVIQPTQTPTQFIDVTANSRLWAAFKAAMEGEKEALRGELKEQEYLRQAQTALGESVMVPVKDRVEGSSGAVQLAMESGWWWSNDELMMVYEVENGGPEPYAVHALHVRDHWGAKVETVFAYFETFRGEGEVLAVIPPGETARGVVTVPKTAPGQYSSVRVDLVTAGGMSKVWTLVQEWETGNPFFLPKTREQIEAERIDKEKQRLDREAEGRVSLLLHGLLGAIWLANPMDKDDLGAARLTGIGIGARYGFNRYLSVEAEVGGAWSKQARFAERTAGELTRSAILGRVQAGFLLTLGQEVIPTLRAGVGLQGVSHDARFVAMSGGPDTDFELEALWHFGGGLEWAAAESFRLGADVTVIVEAAKIAGDGTSAVLQAGIYALGSWKP